MTIIEKMHDIYPAMTDTGKLIYHYIVKNTLVFSLKPIGETAEELNISQMSLVRFAKSLGFDGYSQFKKNLQNEEILNSNPGDRMKKLQESNYYLSINALFEQEVANIEEGLLNYDSKMLDNLVKEILNVENIFIFGTKEQYYLAQIFNYRLSILGIKTNIIDRNIFHPREQLYLNYNNSMFIYFDYYPYVKGLDTVAKEITEAGSKVVLVSDYPACPIKPFSTFSFFHPSKTDLLLNSLSGPLFWINLVISLIIKNMGIELVNLLNKREIYRKKSEEY